PPMRSTGSRSGARRSMNDSGAGAPAAGVRPGGERNGSRPRTGAMLAVAIVLASAVGLLLGGGGVPLYSRLFFPKLMVLGEDLGWKHERNVTKTFVNEDAERAMVIQNRLGFRGPLPAATKGARARVLVIGDSFTEGVQVSEGDLFTAQLMASSPRLEVLN